MRALLVVMALCGNASAGADRLQVHDPRFEIAAGIDLFRDSLFGEGGYRPVRTWPLLVHALAVHGRRDDDESLDPRRDEWLQVRAGIEASACMEIACVFAMADAGLASVTTTAGSTMLGTRRGALIAGRAGLELGRFMYARLALDVVHTTASAFDVHHRGMPGVAVHFAIAMRF